MKVTLNQMITTFLIIFIFSFISCEKEIIKVREDKIPPEFMTEIILKNITDTSVSISWETLEPAAATVQYIVAGQTDTLSITDPEFRQYHSMEIRDLQPSTGYFIQAICADEKDNQSRSLLLSFQTLQSFNMLISEGWAAFESQDYQQGLVCFIETTTRNNSESDSYNGLGWCLLYLDSLARARTEFNKAISLNNDNYDALAGMTIAFYRDSLINQLIPVGERIIELAPTTIQDPLNNPYYIFEHNTTITNLDIIWYMADSYFRLKSYPMCRQMLEMLLVEETPSPDNYSTENEYIDVLRDCLEQLKSRIF